MALHVGLKCSSTKHPPNTHYNTTGSMPCVILKVSIYKPAVYLMLCSIFTLRHTWNLGGVSKVCLDDLNGHIQQYAGPVQIKKSNQTGLFKE